MAPFPRDGLGPRGSVRVEEAGETWPKMAPGKSKVQTNNNYLYNCTAINFGVFDLGPFGEMRVSAIGLSFGAVLLLHRALLQ